MKRSGLGLAVLATVLAAVTLVARPGRLARVDAAADESDHERWEYLVVAGGTTNLTPTGSSSLRTEATQAFGREAFPLEQNLNRLGAQGWELVSVAGNPNDPTYYLKRRR